MRKVEGTRLTEGVKVDRDPYALSHALVRVALLVDLDLLDRERVEPDADLLPVPAPERVFERADAREVRPVELDPVREDLQVVLHLLVRGPARAQEDELAVDEEDDRCDVEVVRRVSEACAPVGQWIH